MVHFFYINIHLKNFSGNKPFHDASVIGPWSYGMARNLVVVSWNMKIEKIKGYIVNDAGVMDLFVNKIITNRFSRFSG